MAETEQGAQAPYCHEVESRQAALHLAQQAAVESKQALRQLSTSGSGG